MAKKNEEKMKREEKKKSRPMLAPRDATLSRVSARWVRETRTRCILIDGAGSRPCASIHGTYRLRGRLLLLAGAPWLLQAAHFSFCDTSHSTHVWGGSLSLFFKNLYFFFFLFCSSSARARFFHVHRRVGYRRYTNRGSVVSTAATSQSCVRACVRVPFFEQTRTFDSRLLLLVAISRSITLFCSRTSPLVSFFFPFVFSQKSKQTVTFLTFPPLDTAHLYKSCTSMIAYYATTVR